LGIIYYYIYTCTKKEDVLKTNLTLGNPYGLLKGFLEKSQKPKEKNFLENLLTFLKICDRLKETKICSLENILFFGDNILLYIYLYQKRGCFKNQFDLR
jgi:hypothetical protein